MTGNFIYYPTLDEGGFICSAEKAEGPWELKKLPKGFMTRSVLR